MHRAPEDALGTRLRQKLRELAADAFRNPIVVELVDHDGSR